MRRIADSLVTKTGVQVESYYDFLISRFVAPRFTLFFHDINIKNPNTLTAASFVMILAASGMLAHIGMLPRIWYRVLIAVVVQLSFILDASDGQLARVTGKTSNLGAWLDKVLDRAGEFIVFSVCGYVSWRLTGRVVFLYLGLGTGYFLLTYTLAMVLASSSLLERIDDVSRAMKREADKSRARGSGKGWKNSRFALVVSRVFFFVNFGIGERYLYLSFFILLLRLDIMLLITSFLSLWRTVSITCYEARRLKRVDRSIGESNG